MSVDGILFLHNVAPLAGVRTMRAAACLRWPPCDRRTLRRGAYHHMSLTSLTNTHVASRTYLGSDTSPYLYRTPRDAHQIRACLNPTAPRVETQIQTRIIPSARPSLPRSSATTLLATASYLRVYVIGKLQRNRQDMDRRGRGIS